MKFLSLFAGIGGFDLGLERAGMECVGQVEINPFCQKVLAKHWPNVKREGDIRDVKKDTFEAVDLVCGGFPCQPFSSAGNKKGAADNRYLWPEMLRVIEIYKPTWVIGENVVGIINMAFDQVCVDLESKGYEVQPIIIPACSVNAPHRRDRVWFLAYSKSVGNGRKSRALAKETLEAFSEVNGLQFNGESKTGNEIRRPTQSPVCGRDNGIPNWMDRIKALGNAVVPQVVKEIGKSILKADTLHYSLQQRKPGRLVPKALLNRQSRLRLAKPSIVLSTCHYQRHKE